MPGFEHFHAIVESLPSGVVIVDREGRIVLGNAEASRVFGYPPDELRGRRVEELVPERFRIGHVGLRQAYFAAPHPGDVRPGRTLLALRKDGGEVPVEIGLNYLETTDGAFVIVSVVDITARLAAESRFRAIFEAAANAFVIVDETGRIALVNPHAERLFGYSSRELAGQTLDFLLPEALRSRHQADVARYVAHPSARPMGAGRDLKAVDKLGREVAVEIALKPIELDGRRHVLATIVDISPRKEAESRLLRANAELQQRAREMEQFIFTVSHDLKAPIVTSMSFIQFLREDLATDGTESRVSDHLRRLERANRRMSLLIDDLLRLSRVGRIELDRNDLDMAELMRDLARDLGERFPQARITIADSLPPLHADRTKVTQLFDNLLSNACKYGVRDGIADVEVGAEQLADEVRYFVRDRGPGIAPQYQQKIFKLFERLHNDDQGSGVGLTIVERVAQLHGGRAWVVSSPDEGATFWVAFPTAAKETP